MARAKYGDKIEWPFPYALPKETTPWGFCPCCEKNVIKLYHYPGFPPMCNVCYRDLWEYSMVGGIYREDPYNVRRMPGNTQFSVDDTIKMMNYAIQIREDRARREQESLQAKNNDGWTDRGTGTPARIPGEASLEDARRSLIRDCGWTEEKEISHYLKVLPPIDERRFDFELCDRKAFQDYVKKICIDVNYTWLAAKTEWFRKYVEQHSLVDVKLDFTKYEEQRLYQIRLIYQGETVDAAHEKFRRIILKYRKDFPYLSDISGFVHDEKRTVVVVLRNYHIPPK